MRHAIILLLVIFAGLALYTGYGLITFEPQRARPFVFSDPVLPPELIADQQAAAADAISMTPEQQEQTTAAMAQITQAINLYRNYERDAGPQAVSAFVMLNTAILNGRLPAYLLSQNKNVAGQRSYELITLDPKNAQSIAGGQQKVTCEGLAGKFFDILIGDSRDNKLECDAPAAGVPQDRVFLGGPGDDVITSSNGNSIISAGTGDDTITTGAGRTIILLDDAWGKDTLTVDCTEAKVDKIDVPPNFPVPWVQEYTNFIVLGPRLRPSDISWTGNVLTNKVTGDTLTVNQPCFNLVAAGN